MEPLKKRGERGRPSAERTASIDAAIILIATELFLTKGFEGTSMDAVAERAAIPRTTLYRRYEDKSALLIAVLQSRRAAWTRAAARQEDPKTEVLADRLKHHVALTLQWASTAEVRHFLRITSAAIDDTDGAFKREEAFGFNIMVDRIASDIMRFGAAEGYPTANAQEVAFTLMAMIAGWIELQSPAAPLDAGESQKQAEKFVEMLVNGKTSW